VLEALLARPVAVGAANVVAGDTSEWTGRPHGSQVETEIARELACCRRRQRLLVEVDALSGGRCDGGAAPRRERHSGKILADVTHRAGDVFFLALARAIAVFTVRLALAGGRRARRGLRWRARAAGLVQVEDDEDA